MDIQSLLNNINSVLDDFWKWLKITPEDYERIGLDQNKGEFEHHFPNFWQLIQYAKQIVEKNLIDETVINLLLTIMALDNESGITVEYIAEKSTVEQLNQIITQGINYPFNNARWQLTELLYYRKPCKYMTYLQELAQDSHQYVRRRARNTINYILYGEKWDIYHKEKIYNKKVTKKLLSNFSGCDFIKCALCLNTASSAKSNTWYLIEDNDLKICNCCFDDLKEDFKWNYRAQE